MVFEPKLNESELDYLVRVVPIIMYYKEDIDIDDAIYFGIYLYMKYVDVIYLNKVDISEFKFCQN